MLGDVNKGQEGADLGVIKTALADLVTDCNAEGINLTLGLLYTADKANET